MQIFSGFPVAQFTIQDTLNVYGMSVRYTDILIAHSKGLDLYRMKE